MTNVIIKDDDGHVIKEFSMIQGIVDNGQYQREEWTSTVAGIVESGVILIVAEWYNVDEEHARANPFELLTLSASYDVEVSIFKGAKIVTKEVFPAADGAYLPNVTADELPAILTKVQGL